MSVSIEIDNVIKRYGDKTIIDGLSLDIKPGEFFTLLGPSGCGKTTLLRMIIGFNSIEGGVIKIDGEVINNVPVNKRNMGMVFQNYAIFPHMSVGENVAFGLKNKKLSKEEIKTRVDEILKIVKIEDLKDRMPDQLSGGQQQRVALARAVVTHPKVLLMDEPLSNLDAKLRIEMRNAIKNIQQQMGITTVYVTHDQEEALAVSDRIAIMNKGVIQQIGTPKQVYEKPANTFVSNFIGTSNILDAKVEVEEHKHYLSFKNGYREEIDFLDEAIEDKDVFVSIRPQDFTISTEGEGIEGIVKNSMFLGINTHYFIELSQDMIIEVTQDPDVSEDIEGNTKVYLKINPKKINIFDKESQYNLVREGESYGYEY